MNRIERLFDAVGRPHLGVINGLTTEPISFAGDVRQCVRVVADDAWAWFWQSEQDVWLLDSKDFGPMLLPFPQMWVEGLKPSRVFAGGWGDVPPGSQSAALLSQQINATGYKIEVQLIVQASFSAPIVVFPVVLALNVTRQGAYIKGSTRVELPINIGINDADMIDRIASGDINDGLWTEAKAALLAISLMNCKNIQLEHHEPAQTRTKKQKRPRPDRLDYHTIKLPAKASASRATKSASMGGAIPLHLVRGHFKTYTEEAPLMGKITGTYWWGWQTRGNREAGQIATDYTVARGIR